MNPPKVLFENESYWLINKPAGWLSVPAREPKPGDPVVSDWLREQLRTLSDDTPDVSPFTVHRLDRFTSGIMLFAKNSHAHQTANQWFQDRVVKKIYHFIAAPPPDKPAVQIKTPIQGKAAQTLFEVIERFEPKPDLEEGFFYGRATPLTGRFHQIREHARDAGFPILGDRAYGGATPDGITRFCLHAFELTLPFGVFRAPIPADFETLLIK